MRAHILHHVPFELIGNIEPWLLTRKFAVTETRFWERVILPNPGDIDLLVIMGGPMSVNDEAAYPWLIAEKAFIRDAVGNGIATLGICLGSQLMANAHGARVQKSAHPEHGWFDVTGVPGPEKCYRFPERFSAFHSHGETFDLPVGAVHLARSEACDNQAFQLGDRAIGIQFHLESTADSARAIVAECGEAFPAGRYVRTADELRAERPDYALSERLMDSVLGYLLRV